VPARLVVLGGGIIGCEFASIFRRFGSEVTIIEMLPRLIPAEDEDAAKELAKQFGKRGIALNLEKQCTKVEDKGGSLTVHFGEGETLDADLMLVSVGRAPLVEGLGLEELGVTVDRKAGIATDARTRQTAVPHIYAVGDCAGYWQLAHTAFREGEVAAEHACGHDSAMADDPAVPRPIYTDPEIASVGLTEAEARDQYGDDVAVGVFPWVANARAVMQDATTGLGEVDPRDAVRRAARPRHGRAARHRPCRDRRRRARRGSDGRDVRRRNRAAPDALRGDQGGRARCPWPADPHSAEEARGGEGVERGEEMSILNKRNAVIGWAVWSLSKQAAKAEAKSSAGAGRSKKGAVGAVAGAAAVAAVVLRRKRRAAVSETEGPTDSE
jgi:hypothetical protein